MFSREETNPDLIVAAQRGCKDIAEQLIASGASAHVVDSVGQTPLHVASAKGHRDVVELLIANGAQLDAKTKDGSTPLYIAAGCQRWDIAQLLLNCGATVDLDIAVMLGDIELVKHYLSQGIDANSKIAKGYQKGESWLNIAAGYKHRNLIELLLHHGARVNEKAGSSKSSPLHQATLIRGGRRDICELLIAHGADVNAEDINGNTPLHSAALLGNQEIVELLWDCGAKVNALDTAGRSPLFDAAQHHRLQVVEYLLSRGAEVNLTDKLGFTPLLRALQRKGGDEIARVLVVSGADVNVQFPQGSRSSPLRIAIAQKNKELVELLLAHGARESLE